MTASAAVFHFPKASVHDPSGIVAVLERIAAERVFSAINRGV